MIKFFRKIRQRLLSENKFSKYLLYAIGEIILVVIGILIALQINTMREHALEQKKEQAFLREINLDFKSNKVQLDSIMAHNKNAMDCCHHLQKQISILKKSPRNITHFENNPLRDTIMYYQGTCFTNKSFNPKNGTVRALINSSSFDLIQNDSLRRLLISWNDVLGDYLEEEQFAMDILFKEYFPFQRRSYDFEHPFSPDNMRTWFGPREFNFREERTYGLEYLLETVESEGIVSMINDIIRLTEITE
ncbi:DUF6090 family protein [Winogradskyella sp.]|uniref:DUF6090 family protein n=1 Tax=Winogradskyella sp. TaxID=1883156 RepID=UPI003BA9EDEC